MGKDKVREALKAVREALDQEIPLVGSQELGVQPLPWATGLEGAASMASGPCPRIVSTLVGDPDLLRNVLSSMAGIHPEKKVLVLGHPVLKDAPGWSWEGVEGSTEEEILKALMVRIIQSLESKSYVMIVVNLDIICRLYGGVEEVIRKETRIEDPFEWRTWALYLPLLVDRLQTRDIETALLFTTSRRNRRVQQRPGSDAHKAPRGDAFRFYSRRVFSLARLTNENFMEVMVLKDKIAPTTHWSYPMCRGEILSRAGAGAYSEEELKARGGTED